MLLQKPPSFTMAALALGGMAGFIQAQPTPNPFDWLDLGASGISAKPGNATCAAVMSWDNLAFPNARIAQSGARSIECRQPLVFQGMSPGLDFSLIAAKVSGVLNLEGGSFVDRVEVAVEYLPPPSGTSKPATTDWMSNTTLPYGRDGRPYRGVFNLTANLWPVDTGPYTARGRSSCVARPELAVRLFVSVSRGGDPDEEDEAGGPPENKILDALGAPSVVEQLQVGFITMWGRCEAAAGAGRGRRG